MEGNVSRLFFLKSIQKLDFFEKFPPKCFLPITFYHFKAGMSRSSYLNCHKKSNGLTNQENFKNGSRYLVKLTLKVLSKKKVFAKGLNCVKYLLVSAPSPCGNSKIIYGFRKSLAPIFLSVILTIL
jgi:hypothetical protein